MNSVLRLLLLFFSVTPLAFAGSVHVEVGVLANGAKFIGDKTGGAEVSITEAVSGRLLAKGVTQGGTGSTSAIMGSEGGLYKDITSDSDAVFAADIDIDAPMKVIVSARGPVDHAAAMASASKSIWLIPGKTYSGANRIMLGLSGYIIEPVETAINDHGSGRLKVKLSMLCGCAIEPDGTWDANRMEKTATLTGKTGIRETVQLQYVKDTVYQAEFSGKTGMPDQLEVVVRGLEDDNAAVLTIPLFE